MDDQLAVWWYEGEASFGKQIFDLATMSLSYLQRESGLRLPYQLHVVLSPDAEAFAEWHDYAQDWWAGEAYPEMGLTVQIASPSDSWDWVQSVICHEVAHLFFYQATYNALSSGPATWMDEGYAQYHQCPFK
jgi:Peptidase MA superfamily